MQLEPDGEFTVELRANGLHSDISWQIAEVDTEVVDLQWPVHDTDAQSLIEHSMWFPTISPETHLGFVGKALGKSPLVLEIRTGDGLLDIYELLLLVVEDACDVAQA